MSVETVKNSEAYELKSQTLDSTARTEVRSRDLQNQEQNKTWNKIAS